MNGELAQLIALAVHGSAWLKAGAGEPPTFAGNSAFQFVRSLDFQWAGSDDHPPSRADAPPGWLRQIRDRGGQLLLLARQRQEVQDGLAAHNRAAFANGGECALRCRANGGAERWAASWTVDPELSRGGAALPADKRIWDIRYEGSRTVDRDPDATDLVEIQARLEQSVQEAREFALVEGWTSWAERLGSSHDFAVADDARQPYHQDLLLASTPLEIARLLASASQAWVFGGMGWWNDQIPERHPEVAYETVTATLYDAVLSAIVAAANAAALAA